MIGCKIVGSKFIIDILDIILIDCSWLLSNNIWIDCMCGKKGGGGGLGILKISFLIFMVKLLELCWKIYLFFEFLCKKFLELYMNWMGGG